MTPLPLLHLSRHLLIVDKPTHLPSAPHEDPTQDTAVSRAIKQWPELKGIFSAAQEYGLLHRLDNDTSGCLAFARTPEAYTLLRDVWKTSSVTKEYHALVTPDADCDLRTLTGSLPLLLNEPLVRHRQKRTRMFWASRIPQRFYRGEPLEAETLLHSLKPFEMKGASKPTLVAHVTIRTGVMHQIRVHLSGIGLPIFGDFKYGTTEAERLWLHASSLRIKHPKLNLEIEASAPLPWKDPSPLKK